MRANYPECAALLPGYGSAFYLSNYHRARLEYLSLIAELPALRIQLKRSRTCAEFPAMHCDNLRSVCVAQKKAATQMDGRLISNTR